MGTSVCLAAHALEYPRGAGHLWVYLNWALGLRDLGCKVTWLEVVDPWSKPSTTRHRVRRLEANLEQFGFEPRVTLVRGDEDVKPGRGRFDVSEALDAELLLNLRYTVPEWLVRRFHRTALVDIDPGFTQLWMSHKWLNVPEHDRYFTTGEGVGRTHRIPDVGIEWIRTRPCVALSNWHASAPREDAPFTTITHWDATDEWLEVNGQPLANSKRAGFGPFLTVPTMTGEQIELATRLGGDRAERRMLELFGWRVVDPFKVAGTPDAYREYIANSAGEFSCTKPGYQLLETGWISDRTLCYLASGRAAVVQQTGRSEYMPNGHGLFRFRTPAEAARAIRKIRNDPEGEGKAARLVAEEHFDARKVSSELLTSALS